MVYAVVDPKFFENIFRRLKNMDHIMNGKVVGVPYQHTWQKGKYKITQDHTEDQQQNRGERDADERRHGQTAFVLWKFMMNAMHYILDLLPGFVKGGHMKYMAM